MRGLRAVRSGARRPSALPAAVLATALAVAPLPQPLHPGSSPAPAPLAAQEAEGDEAEGPAAGGTGSVAGEVTDALRGETLSGLEVRVLGTELATATDGEGAFVFWEVPAGAHEVAVELPPLPGLGALAVAARVEVESGRVAEVRLERPGPRRHRDLLCGESEDGPSVPEGAIAGRVTRGDGTPVSGAEVAFEWEGEEVPVLESLLGALGQGVESRATLKTDSAGRFAACGVPLDRPVELSTGETTRAVTLTAERPFRLLELAAARAAGAAVTLRRTGEPPAITGRVRSAGEGAPLAAARVALLGTDRDSATDPEGRFRITPVEPGEHRIAISHVGRGTDTVAVRVEPESTTEVRLTMERAPVELPELEATVREDAPRRLRGFAERIERGWGRILGRDEIEADPAPLASFVARKNIYGPGVKMKPVLGTEYCEPTLFVDDRRADWLWEVSMPASQAGNPIHFFAKEEVSAVEIYPAGQVPSEFGGSTNGCGAIAVWTRAYVNRYGPR